MRLNLLRRPSLTYVLEWQWDTRRHRLSDVNKSVQKTQAEEEIFISEFS